jgi:hypothetical protein
MEKTSPVNNRIASFHQDIVKNLVFGVRRLEKIRNRSEYEQE